MWVSVVRKEERCVFLLYKTHRRFSGCMWVDEGGRAEKQKAECWGSERREGSCFHSAVLAAVAATRGSPGPTVHADPAACLFVPACALLFARGFVFLGLWCGF